MFFFKNKYFFIIESIKDIKLKKIKNLSKFNIIYRNNKPENIDKLKKYRLECKSKKIKFFVANDINLMFFLKADGLYISAKNKNLNMVNFKKSNFSVIGAAHNVNEIMQKKNQGCSQIFLSRIFDTSYKNKKGSLGLIRFNLIARFAKIPLTALGGIKEQNLKKLKHLNCNSFALLSDIKENNYLNKIFY